jgi:hypothetical protein
MKDTPVSRTHLCQRSAVPAQGRIGELDLSADLDQALLRFVSTLHSLNSVFHPLDGVWQYMRPGCGIRANGRYRIP